MGTTSTGRAFVHLNDSEKKRGVAEGYFLSTDYLDSTQFVSDCATAMDMVEGAIVSMASLPNDTMRACGVLLAQLGQALRDPEKTKAVIAVQGMTTMGVSSVSMYGHPIFVIDNSTKQAGVRMLNTVLLHEAMHYADGDALVTIDLLERFKYELEDGSLTMKQVGVLSNMILDLSQDSSVSAACRRDRELGTYCDGPLLQDHACQMISDLIAGFKHGKMDDVPGLSEELNRLLDKTEASSNTKLDACTDLINLFLRLPESDDDALPEEVQVHVVCEPGSGGSGDSDEEGTSDEQGTGSSDPVSAEAARAEAEGEVAANIAKAAQMAGASGALDLVRIKFKPLRRPIDWKQQLSQVSTSAAAGSKPSIKKPYQPELYRGIVLPSKVDTHTNAVIVFDVSGSMVYGPEKLGVFLTEIRNALVSSVKNVHIVPFDHVVYPTVHYDRGSAGKLVDFQTPGGGGTVIDPAIKAVSDRGLLGGANLLILITDLYLSALPKPSQLPMQAHQVVWLVPPSCDSEYKQQIERAPQKYGRLFVVR